MSGDTGLHPLELDMLSPVPKRPIFHRKVSDKWNNPGFPKGMTAEWFRSKKPPKWTSFKRPARGDYGSSENALQRVIRVLAASRHPPAGQSELMKLHDLLDFVKDSGSIATFATAFSPTWVPTPRKGAHVPGMYEESPVSTASGIAAQARMERDDDDFVV